MTASRPQVLIKQFRWPDLEPVRGMPREDVENIRPETQAIVQIWLQVYGDTKDVIQGVESAGY